MQGKAVPGGETSIKSALADGDEDPEIACYGAKSHRSPKAVSDLNLATISPPRTPSIFVFPFLRHLRPRVLETDLLYRS